MNAVLRPSMEILKPLGKIIYEWVLLHCPVWLPKGTEQYSMNCKLQLVAAKIHMLKQCVCVLSPFPTWRHPPLSFRARCNSQWHMQNVVALQVGHWVNINGSTSRNGIQTGNSNKKNDDKLLLFGYHGTSWCMLRWIQTRVEERSKATVGPSKQDFDAHAWSLYPCFRETRRWLSWRRYLRFHYSH